MKSRNIRASFWWRLILIFQTGIAVTCYAYQPNKLYHLTILFTNDHHGHFWSDSNNDYGMAARKTLIDQIRKQVKQQGGYVLLLSGGDVNTGVPESDLLHAEPDFKAMSQMKYDTMVLGNHEFDNPIKVLRKQQSWANFPFLSANIYDKKTGKRIFKPYLLKNFSGLKVAIIGLTTESTAQLTFHHNNLIFKPAIQAAKKLVASLQGKTDLIIALTHLGFYPQGNYPTTPGDITLARKVPLIDIIIGGHSHTALFKPHIENGVIIAQAFHYGQYLGRMDLTFKNGHVRVVNYKLIPITKNIPPDQKLKHMLSQYRQHGRAVMQKIVGRALQTFSGSRLLVRYRQTAIGQLIGRVQAQETQSDIGIINGGSIRAGIPAGNITYRTLLKVFPFGNTIVTFKRTGKQLKAYLQTIISMRQGSGGYPQIYGVSITLKNNKIITIKVHHKKLINNHEYSLSITSAMAKGLNGYPIVTSLPSYVNTYYTDIELFVNYLTKHSPLNIKDYSPQNVIIVKEK